MKRKTLVVGAAVVAILGIGATTVVARSGEWCDAPPIARKAGERLDALESALALRPDQQAAWDLFESSLRTGAGAVEAAVSDWRASPMPATALGRLEKMQTGLDHGQAALGTLTEATRALYPTLDAGQQAIFDREFRFRRGGWGHWRHGEG